MEARRARVVAMKAARAERGERLAAKAAALGYVDAPVEEHHAALQSVDAGQQIQRPMPIRNPPEIEELNRQRAVRSAEVELPTHLIVVSWTTSGGFMTCAESSAPCGTVHVVDGAVRLTAYNTSHECTLLI